MIIKVKIWMQADAWIKGKEQKKYNAKWAK